MKTSLENVLSGSDVIVCLAPITPATKGMIGRRELDMIRPNSVFVNVSRGAIVDSDALINRLKRGDIVRRLDVFDPEPIPPDSEIIRLPNTFLSPHIAGVTLASNQRFFTLMVDELERFFRGDEPLFQLNPVPWPTAEARRHLKAECRALLPLLPLREKAGMRGTPLPPRQGGYVRQLRHTRVLLLGQRDRAHKRLEERAVLPEVVGAADGEFDRRHRVRVSLYAPLGKEPLPFSNLFEDVEVVGH